MILPHFLDAHVAQNETLDANRGGVLNSGVACRLHASPV